MTALEAFLVASCVLAILAVILFLKATWTMLRGHRR